VVQKQALNDKIFKIIHVLCNVNDEMGAKIVHQDSDWSQNYRTRCSHFARCSALKAVYNAPTLLAT